MDLKAVVSGYRSKLAAIPRQSPRRQKDVKQSSVEPNMESKASFESRMMQMMEGFSQRLKDLATRVESTCEQAASGGTSTEVPPSTLSTSHNLADRPLDELLPRDQTRKVMPR